MKRTVFFILRLLLAAVFLMAGWAKLSGNPMMVQVFATVGLGQWLRYLTGGLEVAGALGMLSGITAGFAAATLSAVMVGAVLTHLIFLGGGAGVPLVLLALNALVAGERWQAWHQEA